MYNTIDTVRTNINGEYELVIQQPMWNEDIGGDEGTVILTKLDTRGGSAQQGATLPFKGIQELNEIMSYCVAEDFSIFYPMVLDVELEDDTQLDLDFDDNNVLQFVRGDDR